LGEERLPTSSKRKSLLLLAFRIVIEGSDVLGSWGKVLWVGVKY